MSRFWVIRDAHRVTWRERCAWWTWPRAKPTPVRWISLRRWSTCGPVARRWSQGRRNSRCRHRSRERRCRVDRLPGNRAAVATSGYGLRPRPSDRGTSAPLVVCLTALMALRPHWMARRVRLEFRFLLQLQGVGGAIIGTSLSEHLDADVLMLAFSGVIVAAAVLMSRRSRQAVVADETASTGPERIVPHGEGGVAILVQPFAGHSFKLRAISQILSVRTLSA